MRDDKGQMYMHLKAYETLKVENINFNIKFMIEEKRNAAQIALRILLSPTKKSSLQM